MSVSGYAGSAMAKVALAVLGKVSATTFTLTVGTAVVAVVAGAVLVAQMVDFEILDCQTSDEAKRRKGQM